MEYSRGGAFTGGAERFRSRDGAGSSLKVYQAKFPESHLADVANMPVSVQRKVHEFRNQLDLLNQEIPKIDELMKMTFNSSISERNYQIVTDELKRKYLIVQEASKLTADKVAEILPDL